MGKGAFVKDFYALELQAIRKEAEKFAEKYPALAPMLSGQSNDPDVERLLEGTAYLCARIQKRLAQTAPHLAQSLLQLIFPQALLPLPSSTMVQFALRQGFGEPVFVPKGTQLSSRQIGGVSCLYTTDSDTTVHPIAVTNLVATPAAGDASVSVSLTLTSLVPYTSILKDRLVFYLAGSYANAAQRFFALARHLESITITKGGHSVTLPGDSFRPHDYPLSDSRLPGRQVLNRPYIEMLRYFYLPQQLLCFCIDGLEKCPGLSDAGDMIITFTLRSNTLKLPVFDKSSIVLNTISATNVFSMEAEPMVFTHTQTEYLVQLAQREQRKLEVLSIERVQALLPGGKVVEYTPFDSFMHGKDQYCYSVRQAPSTIQESTDFFVSPIYADATHNTFAKQTVAIRLLCCNHTLPSMLGIGDINVPTESTPMHVVFSNITAPTGMQPRNMTEAHLWLYLSQVNANLLPFASADILRTMLELYLYNKSSNPELVAANLRRCSAIRHFSSQEEHRIVRGRLHRGRRLDILLDSAAFAGEGDLYLFANALNRFLSCFATVNNYTRLLVESSGTGEIHAWRPRLGQKLLS